MLIPFWSPRINGYWIMATAGNSGTSARWRKAVSAVPTAPGAALLEARHLLGRVNLARDRVVDMGLDHLAGRVAHVGELLRQAAWGEEVDTRFAEAVSESQVQKVVVISDGVDHYDK